MTDQAKILAVDDEPDFEALIKQRFRRQIRSQEYAFRFARHGEEALAVLADDPGIELLLLDINMPVMDGLTLLSVLQQRQIPGAFDFVTKPVDLNDLEITVRKTLDEIARVRELERRRAAAERARTNLARYFSPNLVGLLAEQDEPLGPVRRETVAVLFADIVGFTRMAERMAPEAVVAMLREFHQLMATEIFACSGTIEKYIGDAILAVFGLPTSGPEDAGNAVCCAGRMLEALNRWNIQRSARGEPALAIGIGINYGPAVLGDVGSDQGLSFTVIGDTVNTAHRLQVLTRRLQTSLVIADALVARLEGRGTEEVETLLSQLRDRGDHMLRGRSTPVRIWTKAE